MVNGWLEDQSKALEGPVSRVEILTYKLGAGTTADLFIPVKRAKVTTLFIMAPFAGPALGYVSLCNLYYRN